MLDDSANYEALGRVEVETEATKSGYNRLYTAAKRLYPDCDDVVNVKIENISSTETKSETSTSSLSRTKKSRRDR